jgi:hypothetical protein
MKRRSKSQKRSNRRSTYSGGEVDEEGSSRESGETQLSGRSLSERKAKSGASKT